MAADMHLAKLKYFDELGRAAREPRCGSPVRHVSDSFGLPALTPWSGHTSAALMQAPTLGMGAHPLALPPAMAAAFGQPITATKAAVDVPSPFGLDSKADALPARLLQTLHPVRYAARRHEAAALLKSLPPGVVIQLPRRPALTPPDQTRNLPSAQEH